jgi:hypothetical protein
MGLDNGFEGRTLKDSNEDTSQRTRRSLMTRMYVCPTGTSLAILLPPDVMTRFLPITCAVFGVASFPNRFAFIEYLPTSSPSFKMDTRTPPYPVNHFTIGLSSGPRI